MSGLCNVTTELRDLAAFLNTQNSSIWAPREVQEALLRAVTFFSQSQSHSNSQEPLPSQRQLSLAQQQPPAVQYNVQINRKTVLDKLYVYPSFNSPLDYPETSTEANTGHPPTADPNEWLNPARNVVYSLGHPCGMSGIVHCPLLVDNNDVKVPCRVLYSTCMLLIVTKSISR